MTQLEFTAEAVDSQGNTSPVSAQLTYNSGAIPISGLHTSSLTLTPGQTYYIDGIAQFRGCSLINNGAGVLFFDGSFLELDPDGYQYEDPANPGNPTLPPTDTTNPGYHVMNGGWTDSSTVTYVKPIKRDGTGDDPTWQVGDDIYSVPHTYQAKSAVPHTKGDPAPFDAETGEQVTVFNTTRRAGIYSPNPNARAYIMFHPTADGTKTKMHNLKMWNLGPNYTDGGGNQIPLQGFFSFHCHQMGDNSRGMEFFGTVMEGCFAHGIWYHGSHGIKTKDFITHRVEFEGVSWDFGTGVHESNDLEFDGPGLICDMRHTPSFRPWADAFRLMAGSNNRIGADIEIAGVNGRGEVWVEGLIFPWVHQDPQGNRTAITVHHCAYNQLGSRAGIDIWWNTPSVRDDFDVLAYCNGTNLRIGAYTLNQIVTRITRASHGAIGISLHELKTRYCKMAMESAPSGTQGTTSTTTLTLSSPTSTGVRLLSPIYSKTWSWEPTLDRSRM